MSAQHLSILDMPPRELPDDEGFILRWLDDRGFSENTRSAYLSDLHDLMHYIRKPLQQLTLDDFRSWHMHLCGAGRSARTRNRKLATVRSFYWYFEQHLRLAGLPYVAPPLKLVRSERYTTEVTGRVAGRKVMEQLLAMVKNPRDTILLKLLYYTGARATELCNLSWGDLRPRTLGDGREAGWATVDGKGAKRRDIGLPATFWAELMEWRKTLHGASAEMVLGGWNRKAIAQRITTLAYWAGVKMPRGGCSPHCFRHGHATDVLQKHPEMLIEVSEQLGHSSVAMTQKIYSHLLRTTTSADMLEADNEQERSTDTPGAAGEPQLGDMAGGPAGEVAGGDERLPAGGG